MAKTQNNHKTNKPRFIANKKTTWQKFWAYINNLIQIIINFFKNLFSKNTTIDKNKSIVIADADFFDKIEKVILQNQTLSDLTTPLYNAYVNDPDIARITKLVNGQIPVNENNLAFRNLLGSEDVINHLLKSNNVPKNIKDKVQAIKNEMDKKKAKLHAQPSFKSKPKPKPHL